MSYIFRQKLNLGELVNHEQEPRKILVFEPEQYLGALYRHYLLEHNFDVKHCPELDRIKAALFDFSPHVLVFNAEWPGSEGNREIMSIKRNFPELVVVSTGYNIGNEDLKLLMQAGVSSHINRRLSRPQDLVEIVKAVLTA